MSKTILIDSSKEQHATEYNLSLYGKKKKTNIRWQFEVCIKKSFFGSSPTISIDRFLPKPQFRFNIMLGDQKMKDTFFIILLVTILAMSGQW